MPCCFPLRPCQKEKKLMNDYSSILSCFKEHGETDAAGILNDLCSEKDHDNNYTNKLLHFAIRNLVKKVESKVKDKYLGGCALLRKELSHAKSLTYCDQDIAIISLIAKRADICAPDKKGRKPVDHILQAFFNDDSYRSLVSEISYYNLLSDPHDENLSKLVQLLVNEKILNSSYKFGYSYFGFFVLMNWWTMVEWGLDNGADVSDNGVCRYLPIDAAFAGICYGSYSVKSDIFVRLLHPTNVNRKVPIHDFLHTRHKLLLNSVDNLRHSRSTQHLYVYILKLGARIDIPDRHGNLPMHFFAQNYSSRMNPRIFDLLIPRSVGISPTFFLSLLLTWKRYGASTENVEMFFLTVFPQRVRLSFEVPELFVHGSQDFERDYGTFLKKSSLKNRWAIEGRYLDEVKVVSVIAALTMCGIRPRRVSDFVSRNTYMQDTGLDNYEEARNKWHQYRMFIPSLCLQCVRVIRASLQLVNEDSLNQLPLPASLREIISLRSVMLNVYHELFS